MTAQTNAATHELTSDVFSSEAVPTEREIPVPSATYAARQAGHFGSNARTSAGNDHRAIFNERQQVGLFICDSHSRNRTPLLSAPRQPLPRDNGRDGGPTQS